MRIVFALLIILLPVATFAQSAATLVADRVFIPPGGTTLIAEGNVEVFYDGTRLSASRVVFDDSTDRLTIEGPIYVLAADGTIMTADRAELDPRLENGLLRGARLILADQLQMAANQIDRVEGRYTQLQQVAATSCHICSEGDRPLWDIRASRVVHDTEEKQLYFDNATFRVYGVPIFWVPRMRLPDPTLARATGLLTPQIRSSDSLGLGMTLPYFIRIGDQRDLTLTPFFSAETSTLEARYRQAYLNGDIEVNAAISDDTLTDTMRGYLFAEGAFRLPDDAKLRFDIEVSSDDAYLLDYDYSSKDRLLSQISYERVTDREMILGALLSYQTLRDDENNDTLPPVLAEASWEKRMTPRFGGTLTYGAAIDGHLRTEDAGSDGLGDALRIGVDATWTDSLVTGFGLVVETTAGVSIDHYSFSADSSSDDTTRGEAVAAATFRYPLIRQTARATHIVEPVMLISWSQTHGGAIPNEDSVATEFDQTNLFAMSRFAGEDAVETGGRIALGASWTRQTPNGFHSRLTFGRIYRDETADGFTETSGLSGKTSDWLIAGALDLPSGLGLDGRAVLADDLSVTRSELRVDWSNDKLDLSAIYTFLPADADEERDETVSEWTFDSSYQINDIWSVGLEARYDVAAGEPSKAGLEVGWQNECVTVDFSVSRRFTSSTTVQPSTDYGLTVGLNGFAAGNSGVGPSHRCQN